MHDRQKAIRQSMNMHFHIERILSRVCVQLDGSLFCLAHARHSLEADLEACCRDAVVIYDLFTCVTI